MSGTVRLTREIEELKNNPPSNCTAQPLNNNIYNWKAQLFGPQGTVYEGGIFRVNINIPSDYPFRPPKINFETKIYHPNISNTGSICMDILKDKWSPALTISKVLMSITSLLNDPNPDDPLEPDIAKEYREDYEKFKQNAQSWTAIHALV